MDLNQYIGIPFASKGRDRTGLDCWGLLRLIYAEQRGIELPCLADTYEHSDHGAEAVLRHREGWLDIVNPSEGDLVLFRVRGEPHIGMVLEGRQFIHARDGAEVCIESLDSVQWASRIEGFYTYAPNAVSLIGAAHPLRTNALVAAVPAGSTLLAMIEAQGVSPELLRYGHAWVNDLPIPFEQWGNCTPLAGDRVEFRIAPRGGGGIRMVLTLAVMAAAAWVSGGAAIGGVAMLGSTSAAIGGAVVATAGMMLVNAIAPIRPPSSSNSGQGRSLLGLNGGGNQENPYGAIPVVLGTSRFTPPLAAEFHTSSNGSERFLHILLLWGYGPLSVDYIEIGDTPLSAYEEVKHLTVTGAEVNYSEQLRQVMALYGKDTDELSVGVDMRKADLWVERTTAIDADVIELVFSWPQGLHGIGANSGSLLERDTKLDIEWRKSDQVGWNNVNGAAVPAKRIIMSAVPPKLVDRDVYEDQYRWATFYVLRGTIHVTYGAIAPSGVWDYTWSDNYRPGQINSKPVVPVGATALWHVCVKGDDVQYATQRDARPAGCTGFWLNNEAGLSVWIESGTTPATNYAINLRRATKDAFEQTITIDPPTPGEYVVRVRRIDDETLPGNTNINFVQCQWSTLRSIANRRPVNFPTKLAMTAIKIRATNQLNGSIEAISGRVSSICKSWNGSAWLDKVKTSNPADLYRYVRQHPANAKACSDAQLNLAEIQDWSNYCRSQGFTYNFVNQQHRDIDDLLADICAAGRASPRHSNGLYGVVVDKPKSLISQHITPHNSWGFEGERLFPDLPHALRVNFLNAEKDFEPDELLVYMDGYNSVQDSTTGAINQPGYTLKTPTLYESIELPGVTRKEHAYKLARFHLAQARLRPETYTVNMDIERLTFERGARVKVTHDVPMWGIGSGRVKHISRVVESDLLVTGFTFGQGNDHTNAVTFAVQGRYTVYVQWTAPSGRVIRRKCQVGGTLDSGTTELSGVTFTTAVAPEDLPIANSVDLSFSGQMNYTYGNGTKDIITVEGEVKGYRVRTRQTRTVVTGSSIVELDETLPMKAGITYSLRARTQTGGTVVGNTDVKASDGYYDELEILNPLLGVNVGDLCLYGEINKESVDCIVKSIESIGGMDARITLVDYAPEIFNADDEPIPPFDANITRPPRIDRVKVKEVPSLLSIESGTRALVRETNGRVAPSLIVAWKNPAKLHSSIDGVEVQIRNPIDGIWDESRVVQLKMRRAQFTEVVEGSAYDVRARYVTKLGVAGPWAVLANNHVIVGKTEKPSNVIGLTATVDKTGFINLNWADVTDLDLKKYEIRTANSNWGVATGQRWQTSRSDIRLDVRSIGTLTFFVRAVDTGNRYSTTSASVAVTVVAPSAPTGLTRKVQGNAVVLDWVDARTGTFNVSYYEIYDSKVSATAAIGVAKASNFTITKDVTVGTHNFTVRAVDIDGNKSATSAATQLVVVAPSAPTLTKSTLLQDRIVLDWTDARSGTFPVAEYEVWDATTKLADVKGSALNVFISTLSGIATRQFKVRAVDTEGNTSAFSTLENVDILAPATPTGLTRKVQANSVILDWNDVVATSYPLSRYVVYDNGVEIGRTKASNFTVTKNVSIGSHSFTVKSMDSVGNLSAGSVASPLTVVAPSVPSGLTSKVQGNAVILDWADTKSGTFPLVEYEVYDSKVSATVPIGTTKASNFTITKDVSIGAHVFTVKAVDSEGNKSAASAVSNLTVVAPAAPTGGATVVTDTHVTLSWVKPASKTFPIVAYHIKNGTTVGSATVVETAGLSKTVELSKFGAGWSSKSVSVWAEDSEGNLSATGLSITVTIPTPANVTGLQYKTYSRAHGLVWTDVEPSLRYIVKRGPASNTAWASCTFVAQTADASLEFSSGMFVSGQFYFVKAYNPVSNKESAAASTGLQCGTKPLQPTNINIGNGRR